MYKWCYIFGSNFISPWNLYLIYIKCCQLKSILFGSLYSEASDRATVRSIWWGPLFETGQMRPAAVLETCLGNISFHLTPSCVFGEERN
jgi:hypothetical protein